MVQHFVVASTTTSTAVTEDTAAATAFSPAGESEIQERGGGIPRLIGHIGITNDVATVSAVGNYPYYRIECNTWPSARYIRRPWMVCANATGTPDQAGGNWVQPDWLGAGIPMDRDADWTVKTLVTTANAAWAVGLYLSYGNRIPSTGVISTWRMVNATVAVTANVWSTIGTISDLDPRATYRIGCMAMSGDLSCLAARVTSPSNNTFVGCMTNNIIAGVVQPTPAMQYFPLDSIIVTGVETIDVQALADGAARPTVWIGFEEIATSGSGSQLTVAKPGSGPGGLGALAGGLGSLFGKPSLGR